MTDNLPRNVEAEAALIGAMMIDNSIIDTIADRVTAADFFEPLHGRLFETVTTLAGQGKVANPVSVKPFFEADEAMKAVGGVGYLATLTGSGASLIGARDFAAQIRDLAKLRGVITLCEDLATKARDTGTAIDPAALVSEAEEGLAGIAGDNGEATTFQLADCMGQAEEEWDRPPTGVLSGSILSLDKTMGRSRPDDLIILAGRPGMGKAQPLSAMVLMKTGWRPMGSLKVGDEIASVDGSESVVTGIFPQGERQVFRVIFSDGRSTQCCGEHLWKVRYREWPEDRILSTDKVRDMLAKQRYKNRLSIDLFSGEFGLAEPLPLDPWLLGFLIGDGSICGGQVRFSTKDPEIVEAVQARLPDGLTARYSSAYDYKITGGLRGGAANPVMDALRELGVYETRSHDKFIPEPYIAADRRARIELLRGLMDSDGWAETFGAIRFSTASERLAKDVCALVRSIGGICSVRSRTPTYTYNGERKIGRASYTCRIRLADPAEVFTLARKIERVGRVSNTVRLNFASIEPVGFDEVQCISVSHPSRLYVTDDFTVTHNTAAAISYAVGVARQAISPMEDERADGGGVAFISLEMSALQIGQRAIADIAAYSNPIAFSSITNGWMGHDQKARARAIREEARSLPLTVVDTASLTIPRLDGIVRRLSRSFAAKGTPLRLVVVDYLQLMSAGRATSNRTEEVTHISRGLKQIAKRHKVAVMALSQLSRQVEAREDKRPQLSDLRESGSIEQDADKIVFVFRESYYHEKARPSEADKMYETRILEWEADREAMKDKIEFIVAKRRDGPEGTAVGQFVRENQAVRGAIYG